MRKGCNVCKILDALPNKQTSPGLKNGLICNTRTYFTKRQSRDRTHTHSENQAEGWTHPGNSHFSPVPGRGVTNAHFGSFYTWIKTERRHRVEPRKEWHATKRRLKTQQETQDRLKAKNGWKTKQKQSRSVTSKGWLAEKGWEAKNGAEEGSWDLK